MTLPPGGGKPGHIRETLKLHPHSHFLDASKERSLTAALKNKERSEAEGTVNVRGAVKKLKVLSAPIH